MHTQSGQDLLRIHRFLPMTEAEGPGRRAALWVQGCPIRCPGCANRGTWSFSAGEVVSVASLFERIRHQQGMEGVTFVGGEPFSQARALAHFGRLCQDLGLSIVTFTGYDYERVKTARRQDWNELLAVTDLLLAGPFIQEQRDFSRPWVGSHNQQYVFLTQRYRPVETQIQPPMAALEIHIASEGAFRLNGLAPSEDLLSFRRELAVLGLQTT
jgi:anaerobic ribonucleoside-triphosphate reductase activating protein